MTSTGILYIFAKAPVPGQVKTRLARSIGSEAACAVYVTMLHDVVREMSANTSWTTALAVTPDELVGRDGYWPGRGCRVPQGSGDLGDRMGRFLAKATPARPVVIIGSDIPDMRAGHVDEAFQLLLTYELVMGPAEDGGFCLIGASSPPPTNLFRGVRWSSEHALADTLKNARSVSLLKDRLEDIDDSASYERYLLKNGVRDRA